jgi:predicted RNA-binding Zn ribbon-like protein
MPVTSPRPPHDLQLVIDFVNTLDLDAGTDQLTGPDELASWLRVRTSIGDGRVTAADFDAAIRLREAVRGVILAHNGEDLQRTASKELERAADQGQLSVRFNPDGSTRLEARAEGVAGALAGLLVPIAEAATDGTWERVKACRADACQWAFYDQSRNRSGRWCDMAVCGNRTKVRAYRTKRATGR